MLARIESLYLAILRVVILAIATVALLVTVLALISVAGPVARGLGLSSGAKVRGGGLGDYIEQRKATAPSQPPNEEGPPNSMSIGEAYSPAIRTVANNLYDYTQPEKKMTVMQWEKALNDTAADIPDNLKRDYFDSVLTASNELKSAVGTKLTLDQVGDYLSWNHQQFLANSAGATAKHATDSARVLITLYAAAGSFFFFILVIFVFIFVRIERSLRVVRTVQVESDNA